jgi:hypothetical protein
VLVRDQKLLTAVLSEMRKVLPFALLGFDTDNDSVFMNETVRDYCTAAGVEFTRSRPYRKNDQAWVEQKNGAVVRHTVGYRRYEGLEAAAALTELYRWLRHLDQKDGVPKTSVPDKANPSERADWQAGWDWAAAGKRLGKAPDGYAGQHSLS